LDKSDVMEEYGMGTILDYTIVFITGMEKTGMEKKEEDKKMSEEDKMLVIFKSSGIDEQHIHDIAATYSRMKTSLKGLSLEKKITILMNATNIGMEAYVGGMRSVLNTLQGRNDDKQGLLEGKDKEEVLEDNTDE